MRPDKQEKYMAYFIDKPKIQIYIIDNFLYIVNRNFTSFLISCTIYIDLRTLTIGLYQFVTVA